MRTTHRFPLGSMKPQRSCPGGTRADAKVAQFPALKGMSLSLLTLNPKGVREPHWHPNANELSYVLSGSGLMTVFGPGNSHDTFTLKAGEIVFVPMGSLHHIENSGSEPLQILLCFDHEDAEDLDISAGVSVMPNRAMAATFNLDSDFFEGLKKDVKGRFIGLRQTAAEPPLPLMTSRLKFDLESENPQLLTKGGWAKMSNHFLLPTLQGLSVYSLLLKVDGVREPHWHPNASELNYLTCGSARITLLSPGGEIDTFDMQAGDISFLPRGYLHYIENTGKEEAHFAIFFNNTAPSDIGFSGALGAFSDEVLASLFEVSPAYFEKFPKLQQDLLVVSGAG